MARLRVIRNRSVPESLRDGGGERQPRGVPQRYRLLIFDIDDTLVDFGASQNAALVEIRTAHYPLAAPDSFQRIYTEVNHALWGRFARGEIDQEEIRRQRFTETARRLGLPVPDWQAIGDAYEDALATHAHLFDGALELLEALAPRYRLAAITNGLTRVQKPKAQRTGIDRLLDPYLISQELGIAKPAPAIFNRCLELTGIPASEALMIGDSWESDGRGAATVGLDFCLVAPRRHGPPPGLPEPVIHVASVAELAGHL
jgi:YjjG family noncanonical pyrimidine nucleotidase